MDRLLNDAITICLATASFKALPTLNFATVVAGTVTVLSVPGTFAVLSALSEVENVPKPMKLTVSLLTKVSVIVSNTASTEFLRLFLINQLLQLLHR